MKNIQMTFSIQLTHPPLKTLGVTKYFIVVKHSTKVPLETEQCKRPIYYTMITLFYQTRKYYNENNKIIHLVFHMTLQVASIIGTTTVTRNGTFLSVCCDYGTTQPSNSVPESSDRHAQP